MEIQDLLKVFISKDIAKVVQKYFYQNYPFYEENYMVLQRNNVKSVDCGNINIIRLMIEKGAINYNDGLHNACFIGHMKIAILMIQKGANNWNDGFFYACQVGNIEIVNLMIQKGENDWTTE